MSDATTTMSDVPLIQNFRYPSSSLQRQNDNEQMARLNYMASRIRAALFKWATISDVVGNDLWWWTGVRKELVIYKISLVRCSSLKVGCSNGTYRSHRRLNEYFSRHPDLPPGGESVLVQQIGT